MATHIEQLTNAETGAERNVAGGGRAGAVRVSGTGITTLQVQIAGHWVDVKDSQNNVVQISSGHLAVGLDVSGIYRWNQTGTAVTDTELRSGGNS